MTAPAMSVSTNNGRYYIHPKRRSSVPSVTNIKDVKSIPGLKYAAARDAATYAAENRVKLAGLSEHEAFQLVRSAPFVMTETSPARIGDRVHCWIDGFAKTGQAPPAAELDAAPITARRMWNRFGLFVAHYRPEFVDSEFTVWSDKYGYAGTADLALRLNGKLVLVDTKTGKQPWPDMGIQLAALAHADFILTPDGEEKPLPQFDAFAILHLRPTKHALIPVHNIEQAFQAFLGLKAAFDWEVAYSDKTLGYAPYFGVAEEAA